MVEKPLTYKQTGVDYDAMDPFKRMAQLAARQTTPMLKNHSQCSEVEESRGESAYLIETNYSYLAHVEEGLGTKNLVADAMYELTGKSYDDAIAQDTVAMIVNDMITVGALPLSVAMHCASGDSQWFANKDRCRNLIEGWKNACLLAGCVWSGGETPTLKGIVDPRTIVLSGSGIGVIGLKYNRIRENVRSGDAIILFESSGIHANGLTLARTIAEKLPEGYLTRISDGRGYGETLLDPTHIYVSIVRECQRKNVEIHYAVNITGHGWRKLMRSPYPFEYAIETMPPVPPIFRFIQDHGPVDDAEAYGNFNMGAGFALYVPKKEVRRVLKIADRLGFAAWHAGTIQQSDRKRVFLRPVGIEYAADSLQIR